MLQVMAGYDRTDPTRRDVPVPDYLAALLGDLAGLKIAIEREHQTRADGVCRRRSTRSSAPSACWRVSVSGAEVVIRH